MLRKQKVVNPDVIYVVREVDGEELWFNASPTFEDFDDGAEVLVYRLEKVGKKRINHTLDL
jgi:hypothetical protein